MFDTQVAHDLLRNKPFTGLALVILEWLELNLSHKDEMKSVHASRKDVWSVRPLTDSMKSYAAQDVEHLPALYKKMLAEAEKKGLLKEIFRRSSERLGKARGKAGGAGQADKLKAEFEAGVAVEFGRALLKDAELRRKCEDKTCFISEFEAWQQARNEKGAKMKRVTPSSALHYLSRLSNFRRKKLGVVELNVRTVVIFGKVRA